MVGESIFMSILILDLSVLCSADLFGSMKYTSGESKSITNTFERRKSSLIL